MFPDKQEYEKVTATLTPPSPKGKDFPAAFCVGGLICVIGQLLAALYETLGFSETTVKAAVPCTLILIAAVLTGLHLFDKIAKRAGAGTLVPITGFANAVVAPAIEFKSEGQILGLGAKMFSIAGPVLVFGITASALYGVLFFLFTL